MTASTLPLPDRSLQFQKSCVIQDAHATSHTNHQLLPFQTLQQRIDG